MTRRSWVVVAVGLLWCLRAAHPAVAQATDLEGFLRTLDEKRQELRDFEAAFHQEKYAAAFDDTKVSRGTVRFRQPSEMLWEYQEPDHTFLRVGRQDVRFYFPLLEQIEVYPVSEKDSMSDILDSLTGSTAQLRDDYTLQYLEPGTGQVAIGERTFATPEAPGLELVPKTPALQAQIERLNVWVDPRTFVPRLVVIQEANGDRTAFAFEGVGVNRGLTAADLELPAPPGTEIIRMEPDA